MANRPQYRIGATEAGDAGLDLTWVNKLDKVHGAIVITKNITPEFHDVVLRHWNKLVVHATCTGYGGSVVEPQVPPAKQFFNSVVALVKDGFPKEKIVIRVDPIIPTEKGLDRAQRVIELFLQEGFSRFRISVIDMYPHVRARFKEKNLPLPYGEGRFSPGRELLRDVDEMLIEVREFWSSEGLIRQVPNLRFESCAEPGLKQAIPCGCISEFDLKLLGLESDVGYNGSAQGYRRGCMCYAGKTELLSHRHPCQHGCIYCYWRTREENEEPACPG